MLTLFEPKSLLMRTIQENYQSYMCASVYDGMILKN